MQFSPGLWLTESIRLRALVGEGAMGEIWAGEHHLLRRPVAVKCLAPQLADSADALRRLKEEAKLVARVQGENLPQIFDYAVLSDGTPYIVMELLEGVDLKTRLRGGGVLNLDDAARLVDHVGAALTTIHALGVVHRDVKPENIFLAARPCSPAFTAKLLDFGIAKTAATSDIEETARSGAIVGTPAYMSPEQLVCATDVDGRADLWSLAVVAYSSLTGELPFSAETLPSVCLAIQRGEFLDATARRPQLPAGLDRWFRKALRPDRDGRFATAAEMARAFAGACVPAAHARPAGAPKTRRPPR